MQVYHVVTDRPMKCGQHIIFDENHHSGVYERVQEKMEKVHDIYENPDKYDEKILEHHTSVALRELALEEVRRKKYPQFPSRMSCLYVSRTGTMGRIFCTDRKTDLQHCKAGCERELLCRGCRKVF